MQTERLSVTGMTCGGCTSSVTRVLKGIAGVTEVDVTLSPGAATVTYDDRLTSRDKLVEAVKAAGYGVDRT